MPLTLCQLEPRENPVDLVSATPGVTLPINPTLAEPFALAGSGVNQPARLVRLQSDGSLVADLSVVPFPGFPGEVRVASGDVTGDGITDLIAAAGPGGGPHVKVFDGRTGAAVQSFFAYDAGFTGGVNVALGDVTGDRVADVITGAGAGGGPHVKVFDGRTLGTVFSFFAYNPAFRGGVSVAGGDLTLDGFAEIATGAGPGAGPHVKVFNGRTLGELQSYFAFNSNITSGVNVALGDVSGDGRADLVASLATPLPPPTTSLVGIGPTTVTNSVVAITQNPTLPSTFTRPLDPFVNVYTGGIRVGTADVDGDGRADSLFGTGPGDSRLRVVFGRDTLAGNQLLGSYLSPPLFSTGGLFVG